MLCHFDKGIIPPPVTCSLLRPPRPLRAQLALAQAALALSHLEILKKHCQSRCPVVLVMSCGPCMCQDCPMEHWKEGGLLGGC